MQNPSYSFRDNLLVNNNKYIRFLDNSNVRKDIIGLTSDNHVSIKSATNNAPIFINEGSSGSATIVNANNANNVLVGSKVGIGFQANTSLAHSLTLEKNNFIGTNSDDGFLGLVGGSGPTAGSSVVLHGNSSPGAGDFIANSPIGSIKLSTQSKQRVQVDNQGAVSFTPDGVTPVLNISQSESVFTHKINVVDNTNSASTGVAALSVHGGGYFEKDLYVVGTLFTEKLASFRTLDADILTSSQIQIRNTENAIDNGNGGAFTVAGGASVAKDLVLGGNFVYSKNAITFSAAFVHLEDAIVDTYIDGLEFDPFVIRAFSVDIAFKVQVSTPGEKFEYLQIKGTQSSTSPALWNVQTTSLGDNLGYTISVQNVGGKARVFYRSPGIASFQSVRVNYLVDCITNMNDIVSIPESIGSANFQLQQGVEKKSRVLYFDQNGDSVTTSNFVVNDQGNVGIQTTTPRAALEVNGDVVVTSGNVAIGTTDPQAMMHVTGTLFTNGMHIGEMTSHYNDVETQVVESQSTATLLFPKSRATTNGISHNDGVFSVQRTGLYQISCDVDMFDADGPIDLWLQKNSDTQTKFGFKTSLTEDTTTLISLMYLVANDTVRVRLFNHGSRFSTPVREFRFNEFAMKL
jgi:ethanolamine utilization microcompartment shell protein EutS